MATKDNSSGLFSKVARFVRHPTKDWSELDSPEPESEPESTYGKKALKEMVERKRQNDFVRRREFDQLRKLRRNGVLFGPDLVGRPSFFQGSTTSNLDERAMTLKKIDEIEAQMSRQWWKGKHADMAAISGAVAGVAKRRRTPDDAAPTSVASYLSANTVAFAATAQPSPKAQIEPSFEYEPTQMGLATAEDIAVIGSERQLRAPTSALGKKPDAGLSEFSASKLFSVELGGAQADPDLEEAAIRFANSDDTGAEATLLAVLQAEPVDPDLAAGWAAALFDFYRCTGQQSSFDRVAIDYAQRFGRSAPAWFSTPDLLQHLLLTPERQALAALTHADATVWDCPVELDLPAVHTLPTAVARAAANAPRRLNWSRLKTITTDGAAALAQLFAQWCNEPVRLQFDGADVLEKTLRYYTPSGQKQLASCWWQLRFDALRIMRRHDEFELAALDYCVTYEVSPPPWLDARCDCVYESINTGSPVADFQSSFEDTAPADGADPNHALTPLPGPELSAAVELELTGELLGDATQTLNQFNIESNAADRIVISCARLIRVDFSAAGSILNWVVAREAEGCTVQFRNMPSLVAAFFNVIGINEHARVAARTT